LSAAAPSPAVPAAASAIPARASGSITECSNKPPPAIAVAFRNMRRDASNAGAAPAARLWADFVVGVALTMFTVRARSE
jgi:hypothetical protein